MILENSVGNPDLGLLGARCLAALDVGNPGEAVRTILRDATGYVAQVEFTPATDTLPPYLLASVGNDTLLLAAGCTRMAHATGTMGGYAGGVGADIRNPVNAYFVQGADQLVDRLVTAPWNSCARMTLIGHSLGGALCEWLLTYGQLNGKAYDLRGLTYGAPKPGDIFLASQLATKELRRWMNSDDPVPLLPPTAADTLTVLLAYSSRAVSRFGNFVQPGGGLEITADFQIRPAVIPSAASLNAGASLVTWLLAIDGSSQSAHHILSYVGRLTTWNAAHAAQAQPVLRGGPPQAPAAADRRELNQAEERVVTAVHSLQETQNSGGVSLPSSSVVRAVRQGAVWAVVFGDHSIAITPHRRSAQATARELNGFLHRLQPLAVVDPSALLGTLEDYLTAAADPSSGFVPTMNTTLPE